MRLLRVVNQASGAELGRRIELADRWGSRLRGLLGRPQLRAGEGMMLAPCRSVHMLGMRYPIDVAFLAADGQVLAAFPALAPGLRIAGHRQAHYALELPAGTLKATGTGPGDRLTWSEADAPEPPKRVTRLEAAR